MPAGTPYYITTPIYYVNDRPHIGHCYTTLLADVAARFQRLIRGEAPPASGTGVPPVSSVFLLTGTDEHADKVVTSARDHGVTPQAWADRNAAEFRAAFELMGCEFDDFIRTTEPRHKDRVPGYIERLQKSGAVYKGEYTGWYDLNQEEYVTETAAKEAGFKSAVSGKPLVKRTEPCYFLKLSQFGARLTEHIEKNPTFIQPDARRNETLGRIRGGLQDVPISRPVTDDAATQWGVRMPGDPSHRIYVWIDALFNYLTVVDTPERRAWWPPAVQVLGKDILWFHAVIWPAMLMAMGEPLPQRIYAHGWWISEGRKMSKSLGNFIEIEQLRAYAGRYGLDALRWYLVTQGPLGANDADFAHAKFVEVYNADLANGIGNSASRVSNMIAKYFDGKVPPFPGGGAPRSGAEGATAPTASANSSPLPDFPSLTRRAAEAALTEAGDFDLIAASHHGIEIVRAVDGYINQTEPFKLAKRVETEPGAKDQLAGILYTCAEALRIASLFFSPTMPARMADLWKRWTCTPPPGVPLAELARFGGPHGLTPGQPIEKGEALFMRADPAEPAPIR
ncbi:MAG: methionine--tRNA ligase [Phycisphaerales bacterium]